jgi:hypothetical protein
MALTGTFIYAITICAIFVGLLLLRLIPIVGRLISIVGRLISIVGRLIPIIRRLISTVKHFFQNQITFFLLRKVVYPLLYRRFRFLAPITRLRALALVTYALLTVFLNLNGVHTVAEASIRAGWLSVANLIPLFVSARLAMAANALGLSLREAFAIHTAAGFMVIAQATIHIYLQLRNSRFRLDSSVPFYGFLVTPLLASISTQHEAILGG